MNIRSHDDATSFGKWLRSVREAKGISLIGLSRLSGVAHSTVWAAENISVPGHDRAAAIGSVLGVDVEAMAAKHRKPRRPPPRGPWTEEQREAIESSLFKKARGRNRLTDTRIALGWTGAELSRRSGVSVSEVAALETGYESPRSAACRDDPWREVSRRVADCLGVACEWLWPEHAPPTPRLLRERHATPEERYVEAETRAAVRRAIAMLSPRRREVLACRFGLDGAVETMESIGERMGITKQRVQQIEVEALDELRVTITRLTGERR